MKIKSQKDHEKDVLALQSQVKSFKNKIITTSKKTSTSNATRNANYKKQTFQVDCSSLNGILAIDQEERTATVQPGITIRNLCTATLSKNLIPYVVPEFESITIGGAIMGSAIESSSHLHGQFNDACMEYQIVLGNGDLIKAAPTENSDLFYGISGSYGTFGILVLVKLRLAPSSTHVLLKYHSFIESNKVFTFFRQLPSSIDYVDGVAINSKNFTVMTAEKIDISTAMSKKWSGKIYQQKYPWHPWFYQHIVSQKGQQELMPLKDYLFRYNQGAFWMGRYLMTLGLFTQAFLRFRLSSMKEKIGNLSHRLNPISGPSSFMRLFFSWAFTSQFLYQLWHRVPQKFSENLFMVQDFYLPYSQMEQAFEHFSKKAEIFPLWLCPVKATTTAQFLSPHYLKNKDSTFSHFLNVGFYGIPQSLKDIPGLTKELEEDVESYGGRKMLYSHTYFSKNFFEKAYDLDYYFFLRKKYHADSFKTLYQKVIS